jgi:hypothetical protein
MLAMSKTARGPSPALMSSMATAGLDGLMSRSGFMLRMVSEICFSADGLKDSSFSRS